MSSIALLQQLVKKNSVVQLFIWGYFSSVVVGWLILQLPLCHQSFVPWIDTLFTSASAISTTGLVTVDIGKTFSFLGQLVLLLLIQLGGIGYMTFSSFLILHLRKKPSVLREIDLGLGSSPSQGLTISDLVKQVVTYTVICEMIGWITLYFFFRSQGVDNSLWNAIFHSVSAFCTAGFSLFSSNLEGYKNHLGINATLSFLSLLGAFGFFLWMDFFKRIPNVKTPFGFAARILQAFATTAILTGGFLYFIAANFPMDSSGFQKLTISFFQVVSTITTTGFNTIDIGALTLAIHLLLMILMLFGVSLTGNGIAMRGASFPVLLRLMANRFRSKKASSSWDRKNSFKEVQIALFSFASYSIVLLVSALMLNLVEKQPFLPLFFETASALCTVGLSMGITSELSILAKSFIALLMLVGRIGIFIMGFAISSKAISLEMEKNQEPVF